MEIATLEDAIFAASQTSGVACGSANTATIIAAEPNRRPNELDLANELKRSNDSALITGT
jgi:hypothetical protein